MRQWGYLWVAKTASVGAAVNHCYLYWLGPIWSWFIKSLIVFTVFFSQVLATLRYFAIRISKKNMIFCRFDLSSVFMWRPPWQWDFINRPKYRDYQWSPEQREAIALVKKGVSYEDENERLASNRWLFIQGPPGSGKSQVLLELAVWVLLVLTMGVLVITAAVKQLSTLFFVNLSFVQLQTKISFSNISKANVFSVV